MTEINVTIIWSGDNCVASVVTPEKDVIISTGKTIDAVQKKFKSAWDFHYEGISCPYTYTFQGID